MIKRLALMTMLLAGSAAAHEVQTGPNGGRVVDAGPYHVELVARGQSVEVFITDSNDRPVPPEGFRGTAVLVQDGRSHRIVLAPAGARLAGQSPAALNSPVRGAVQLTAPGGQAAQARF